MIGLCIYLSESGHSFAVTKMSFADFLATYKPEGATVLGKLCILQATHSKGPILFVSIDETAEVKP